MGKENEYEKRWQAIQLYKKGYGFDEVLRRVRRSRGWLSKWLVRYRQQGKEGLRDQSRTPRRIWRKTPEQVIQKILATRDWLVSHHSRRSAFAGMGAEVIQWELKQRKVKKIPAISTIARILSRSGKTRKKRPLRNSPGRPYPYVRAKALGDLQQTDLVGPVYLRGPKGVTRFYSFHTIDVVGQTAWISHFPDKQSVSLCKHLLETWRTMGVPKVSQMDNEMAAAGGGRYPYSLSQVIRLHLLLGIQLVFIPQGEPGRNATVESFNGLWKARVLRRHACPALEALRRVSGRFLQYYHYEKPHRRLRQRDQGTRYPGVLRDRVWGSLRHLPPAFTLRDYQDEQGHLSLPVAKGKISFVRKVDAHGYIEVNGKAYFIRKKLEGQYVMATVYPHRKRLVVKQENRVIKSLPFHLKARVVEPLLG